MTVEPNTLQMRTLCLKRHHVCDKGLEPKYMKNSHNLLIERRPTEQQVAKDLNRRFSKEDPNGQQDVQRCSQSLVRREL